MFLNGILDKSDTIHDGAYNAVDTSTHKDIEDDDNINLLC
jgi:hypothetical protein